MNFNRRQNRIAGPGFHVNVRFDDQTMVMAHSQASEPHARVALGRNHKENFDVKEQELLVCMKNSGMYHDGYTHCFSSANGFPDSGKIDKNASYYEVAEAILGEVKFVGVATTEYKPSKAYSEQGFVAQVGGVTTLINEGETTIKPGDTVALGLNLKIGRKTTRDRGIPRDKIRFCLVKAGNSRALAQQALTCTSAGSPASTADIKRAQQDLAKAETELKKLPKSATAAKKTSAALKVTVATAALSSYKLCSNGLDGMMDFLNKYQELNERVIGKSASYARPGDRLEVILQPRNPY